MSPKTVSVLCLFVVAVIFSIDAAPQSGGFSKSNAQAVAFSGGGGGGPRPGFGRHPGTGSRTGFNKPGPPSLHGRELNKPQGGVSISISKSVSIVRGGAAQSTSSSTASATGRRR